MIVIFIKIIILFLFFLFYSIYGFIPEKIIKKYPLIKIIAILSAIIFSIVYLIDEINKFNNLTYAIVSENGEIIKSRNFAYATKIYEPHKENDILYIIENKYGHDDVEVKPYSNKLKYNIRQAIDGVAICFYYDDKSKTVKTKFKVQIMK